jgi:hypothetical protein
MNITLENIKTAISNATVDGNFNSDLIENASLRKLAINHYAKSIVKSGANTVLKDYVDTSTNVIGYSDSASENDMPISPDSDVIVIGGKTALVIEQTYFDAVTDSNYILGKFYAPTFEDKPYFTIGHFQDSYFGGHYDMTLIDATNDFVKRSQ